MMPLCNVWDEDEEKQVADGNHKKTKTSKF
jgi:hypothetical protein